MRILQQVYGVFLPPSTTQYPSKLLGQTRALNEESVKSCSLPLNQHISTVWRHLLTVAFFCFSESAFWTRPLDVRIPHPFTTIKRSLEC